MKSNLLFLLVITFLTGCSSTIIKGPQKQIVANSLDLKNLVFDQQRDAQLARTQFLLSQDLNLKNAPASDLEADHYYYNDEWNFPGFVCAPIAKYELQSIALSTLGNVTNAFTAAYSDSSDDLSVLFGNVLSKQNNFPNLPSKDNVTSKDIINNCKNGVIADVRFISNNKNNYVLPLAAIVTGAVAAKAVWDATKTLLIVVLQNVDAAKRESDFLAFIRNEDINKHLEQALGRCIISHEHASDDELKECLKQDNSPLSNSQIGRILEEKRIASLTRSYFIWKSLTSGVPNKGIEDIRINLILNQPDLDNSLRDYDEIKKRRVDPEGHFNLVKGWLEMRRVAKGDLTGKERTKVFSNGMMKFVQGGTAIFNAATGVNENVKKFSETLKK